jgi:hypothetical protein
MMIEQILRKCGEGMDWIFLAHCVDRWWVLVNRLLIVGGRFLAT